MINLYNTRSFFDYKRIGISCIQYFTVGVQISFPQYYLIIIIVVSQSIKANSSDDTDKVASDSPATPVPSQPTHSGQWDITLTIHNSNPEVDPK